jgi:hypothetical protein
MFERYTEKARRVIFFARYEASEFGSPHIETEHLLLGIVREAPFVLADLVPGIAPEFGEKWRTQLEHLRRGAKSSTSVDLPLSNESMRVLTFATEEANRMRTRHVGVEHLVLGLLHERHSASSMLDSVGITLQQAREHFGKYSYPPTATTTVESDEVVDAVGAGSSKRAVGVPFVQFVESGGGEHVAVVPVAAISQLPRVGDVVQFEGGENAQRRFKVSDVKHVFERTEKRWPYRDHELTKVVVTVQRVDDASN